MREDPPRPRRGRCRRHRSGKIRARGPTFASARRAPRHRERPELPWEWRILETRAETWHDETDCAASAARLAARVAAASGGDARASFSAFVELHGTLGAGKTTFVRHLLAALGVAGTVRSPTYTLMEPYRVGDLAIAHCDFYRFDDPEEWEDAGFREVFAEPGLKLVEWPEKAEGLLPAADLAVTIEPAPHGEGELRRVRYDAATPIGVSLMEPR